jgi:hypothetical protein
MHAETLLLSCSEIAWIELTFVPAFISEKVIRHLNSIRLQVLRVVVCNRAFQAVEGLSIARHPLLRELTILDRTVDMFDLRCRRNGRFRMLTMLARVQTH